MTKLIESIMEAVKGEPTRAYEAPQKVNKPSGFSSVFLAGSIEMGKAKDWQTEIIDKILIDAQLSKLIVVNPRRRDWDSSWTQEKTNPQFFEQVSWELQNIEAADFVVVVFDPKTQSPITLMELGIISQRKPGNVIVVCPVGFFRKGNVDIVCDRYGIKQVDTIDEALNTLKEKLK